MLEKPVNSTLQYLAQAQNERELFSITSDLLSTFKVTYCLTKTDKRNEGLPIELMQKFSDQTMQIIRELIITDRDPFSRVSGVALIPCDIFTYKNEFSDDPLIMDLYNRLENEGASPFYIFTLNIPGSGAHMFCLNTEKDTLFSLTELCTLQAMFSYVALLQSRFIKIEEKQKLIASLTKREREVLWLMAKGNTDREIAEFLQISLVTVGFHVKNAKNKLGARNKCHAIYLSGIRSHEC